MKRLFLTIFLIGISTLGRAQGGAEQKKLEQRKAEILKEIKALSSLVKTESSKEKSVLTKISDNETKIKLSEKLISTTHRQTRLITDDIYLGQLKINKLNRELKVLKEDYANMLLNAYKNRSEQSRIMFLLSSEDFLQAYKRLQYMKQYASFRKIQGDELRTKMTELNQRVVKLEVQKKDKVKLLTESEKQKETLEKDREEQQKLVKTIQKDKKKYTAEINKKQKEAKDIDRQIDRAIRDAIAAANKKTAKSNVESKTTTAAAATASNTSSNKIVLTKEGKVVSDNFKANKGRLPYPVAHGYISMGYGNQPHPVLKDVAVHNSGVDITTNPNEPVRAVFGGEVLSVQLIKGTGNKIVYIQHGDFITVYYNMESVNVGSGDKVGLKQSIGTVATNPVTNETVLKFYVLQNTTNLNPSSWIAQ
ncbi:peptidoglycan DD-metalloendopeptidase family protein [Flavobacterium zepuense]|uniref:Peptidoglycan DD-metalloendopeptidase family protein n=1 Tax=Flavobacterium zepuense TaxID=2593302 RepID=A0A552UWU9_9FLAO|nr:peptidoglycan DD-metalloendopeptidase family protein [Flavobacterium zepuense]TRW22630.1 peptidoglycan DD-metalloendopeptidase family protein [Flavobacterium zepuense]